MEGYIFWPTSQIENTKNPYLVNCQLRRRGMDAKEEEYQDVRSYRDLVLQKNVQNHLERQEDKYKHIARAQNEKRTNFYNYKKKDDLFRTCHEAS